MAATTDYPSGYRRLPGRPEDVSDDMKAYMRDLERILIDILNPNPQISEVTIMGLDANRLMATDTDKTALSVDNLANWVSGTANQIISTDDGDGTVTLSIAAPLILPGNLQLPNNGTIGPIAVPGTIKLEADGDVLLANQLGIGVSPGTLLQIAKDGDAHFTLQNLTAENTDGGAETRIIFEDHANVALAMIQGSHDGTDDDTKGDLILYTHTGSALTETLRLDSVKLATFAGNIIIPNNANVGSVGDPDSVAISAKGDVTLTQNLILPVSTATEGIVYAGANTLLHTFGSISNLFLGTNAGNLTLSGVDNIGIGELALNAATTTDRNIIIGSDAGKNLSMGTGNVFIGHQVGREYTNVSFNIAIGFEALIGGSNTDASTAIGYRAMSGNTTGVTNTALGALALSNNATGNGNTAIGNEALENASGASNTAVGSECLSGTGSPSLLTGNTGAGWQCGSKLDNGHYNSLFGYWAGRLLTSGDYNIFIGYRAGDHQTTNSNLLIIDNQDRTNVAGELAKCLIYGTFAAAAADQDLRINADLGVHVTPTKELDVLGDILFQAAVNSTTMFQILDVDGGTPILNVDSTNERVGIGTATPAQVLDIVGNIYASLNFRFDDSNESIAIGFNAEGETETSNTVLGYNAGENRSGTINFATLYGFDAGRDAVGANTQTAVGPYAGKGCTNILQTAIGAFAGQDNTGDNQTVIGATCGKGNTGNGQAAYGANSGENNIAGNQAAYGAFSGQFNAGGLMSGFGALSGQSNIGDNCTFFGATAGQFNRQDNNTAIGTAAFNSWTLDGSTLKTFAYTDIDVGNNRITVTGHSFGTSPDYVNLVFVQGTSSIPGITSSTVHQFLVIDANTLEFRSDVILGTGGGSAHKLWSIIQQFTNSTALGYNAEPDASNQVMLGDTNVTNVKTTGEIETPLSKLTALGGIAVKLTNKTGGNTVAGQLISPYSATAVDDAFKISAANSDEVFGIVLDAGIADGSEAWVIISGIADVLMDGGGSARGDRIISSATAGSGDVWNTGGAVATHFLEIGHCIETRTGAGLARCILHFN